MPPKSVDEQESFIKISDDFYRKLLTDKTTKVDDLIKEFEGLLGGSGDLSKELADFRGDDKRKKEFLHQIIKRICSLTESSFASALHKATAIAKNYSISIESDVFDKKIATLNAQRISINCLISILSSLSNAGFSEENLRESRGFFIAALNRFADAGNHDENSIECSVHFLLHIKNLGFINDESLKGLVSVMLEKISNFYSQRDVGSRILRPLCEVAIYCRDVLGVKIPQNFEDKLAAQWSVKDQSITSFLQRNVFADLQKYLETKGGDWKHIPKLAPNICAIGDFTIELEGGYGLIGSDKLKAVKYGDIVVKDRDEKIVAIVEVDGPSHYSIINYKRTYVGSSKARNEYIAKLVGADGLVCVDYQEYEKSLSSGDRKKEYFDGKFSFINRLLQMQEDEAAFAGKSAPSFAKAEVVLTSEKAEVLKVQASTAEGAVAAESKKKKRIPVPELAQELFDLLTVRRGNFDLDEIARFLIQHEKSAAGILNCTPKGRKYPMEIAIGLYSESASDYCADLIVLLKVYGFDALPEGYKPLAEESYPPNFFALMGWSVKSKKPHKQTESLDDSLDIDYSLRRKIIKIRGGEVSRVEMTVSLVSAISAGNYYLAKAIIDRLFVDDKIIKEGQRDLFKILTLAISSHRNDILLLLMGAIKKVLESEPFVLGHGKYGVDNIPIITVALIEDNDYAIRLLADAGYDLNAEKDANYLSVMISSDIECVNTLLDCGLKLSNRIIADIIALSQRVRNYSILKELIAGRRFDINKEDEDGVTWLVSAILIGYKEIALLLLDAGMDVNYLLSGGGLDKALPLSAAIYSYDKNPEVAKEIMEILLDRGANPSLEFPIEMEEEDDFPMSPLLIAFGAKSYELLQIMLSKKGISYKEDRNFIDVVKSSNECTSEMKKSILSFIIDRDLQLEGAAQLPVDESENPRAEDVSLRSVDAVRPSSPKVAQDRS